MQMFQEKTSNKKGATMIELMAMMAIVALGVGGMLGVIGSGVDFAKNTEDTIKAINLAREGIEGVISWRNTNWLRFSSDKTNCWRVLDYNSTCIGGTLTVVASTGSYILYAANGAWYLTGITTPAYTADWNSYRNGYKTWIDSTGFYTQTGTAPTTMCSSLGQTGCLTPFNREIIVGEINTGTLSITSIVRWQGKRNREVTLTTNITNWKAKF
ncbi:type II secretion system protein [Candidatus Gracilibacteria bacterium]|nr:type II secretion system protein [Candidatus Gracilibacteria bacterium]